jgi:hypothetical protein
LQLLEACHLAIPLHGLPHVRQNRPEHVIVGLCSYFDSLEWVVGISQVLIRLLADGLDGLLRLWRSSLAL